MDGKRMRIDDLECSMFESPAKRSRPSPFVLSQAVPKRFLKAYTHAPEEEMGTVSLFGRIFPALVALLTSELCFHKFKATLVLRVEMTKTTADGKSKVERPYFSSKPYTILSQHDIENAIAKAQSVIETNIDKWTKEGSGWVVSRVETMYVNIAKYAPLKGSSYIELPKYLKNKKALINVKNEDQKCLMWALLCALHPVGKNSDRVSKYEPYENELNFTGVNFPVPLNQIPNVEHQNNLSINVFGYSESAGVHPLYLTKDHSASSINLLLITEVKDGKTKSHYCWIKDFNRLCHDQNKHHGKTFFCTRCISPHCSERTLQEHMIYCKGVDAPPCHAVYPEKSEDGTNPTIKFKNIQHMMKAPYVIYADTESIIKPVDSPNTDTNTVQTSEHVPCSFAYTVVRSDGKVTSQSLYRGEDCMDVLFEKLDAELERIRSNLKDIKEIDMTPEEQEAHNNTGKCWICNGEFRPYASDDSDGMWKVRDHDHITGKKSPTPLAFQCFPLASPCTLLPGVPFPIICCVYVAVQDSTEEQRTPSVTNNSRISPYRTPVPVFFHNLKNYDSHHLISAIGRTEEKTTTCTNKYWQAIIGKDKPVTVTDGKISAIVQNMEKLISFSWGQFRFVDSLQFLNASLDKLVNSTPRDAFRLTSALPHHELLMQKGVYPYEYMNDFARFDETSLPPPSEFYSKLSNEHITDSTYKHAQKVWDTFNCATLGDYHDIYLRTDVLLLADVFENFRKTAMATYGLDPAHYYHLARLLLGCPPEMH